MTLILLIASLVFCGITSILETIEQFKKWTKLYSLGYNYITYKPYRTRLKSVDIDGILYYNNDSKRKPRSDPETPMSTGLRSVTHENESKCRS